MKLSACRLFPLLVLLLLLTAVSQSVAAEGLEAGREPRFMLLPRMGIGIEYGGLVVRRGDFSSAFHYRFLFDLMQYGPHLLYMDIDGEIDWGTPGLALAFNRVRHLAAIIGYRYDLGNYYAGVKFDHMCNNSFNGPGRQAVSLHDRTAANIYFVGLELIDKALLVGQESRGIVFDQDRPFQFLGRFHFGINASRVFVRQDSNLNWLFNGRVRLDVLRFHNLVPYVEASGEILGQEQWNFIPRVETGVRVHWQNVEFTPFVQWGHSKEWLRYFRNPSEGPYMPKVIHFESRSYLYAGGRLEFFLDQESIVNRDTGATWQFFPEVHGQGEYGWYPGSRYHQGTGSLNLNLDLVRWQRLSLFANLGFHLDSNPEDFGPDKVVYSLTYGLRYDWPKIFLEGFVRHAARLDVFRNESESPNLAGGRLGTQGMRLGHYNDGISFTSPERFQWLHRFNAEVSLAHYFNAINWPATWNLTTQGRWDILRWGRIIPYVQAGLEWMAARSGSSDVFEYYGEAGARCHGVLDLVLFYRFQHVETIWSFRGPKENQNILGIRVLF